MSHQRAQHVVTFILAAIVIIFASFMFKANQKIMREIQSSATIQDPVIPAPQETGIARRSTRGALPADTEAAVEPASPKNNESPPEPVAPKKTRVIYEMPISDDALIQ